MARYIDADKFMEELNDAQIEFDEHYKGLGKAKVMLSLQPTADVVEVKHGEWIKKFKYSHGYDDYYNTECSLCGYKVEKSGVGDKLSLDNFCPNCGAKMDGKERG